MEGRYPTGLLLSITNCTDPSKEDEFNYWYNHIHIPDGTTPGIYHHAMRFANIDPNSTAGQYVATYETTMEDVSKAREAQREGLAKLGDRGDRRTPLSKSITAGIFKRLGGEFVAARRPTLGILLVLSNCVDPSKETEFSRWYEDIHIPDILDTGIWHTAYRYESLDPQATKAKYLGIFETDNTDLDNAMDESWKASAVWKQEGRSFDGLDIVGSLACRRIWPMQ